MTLELRERIRERYSRLMEQYGHLVPSPRYMELKVYEDMDFEITVTHTGETERRELSYKHSDNRVRYTETALKTITVFRFDLMFTGEVVHDWEEPLS